MLGGVFLGCFGVAIALQNKALKSVGMNKPFYETWQFQGKSGQSMKVASLGYDLVTADILWLRSIQSFGGRGMTNRDWKPIYNLFETITELDPYFVEAYTFGNLVIGDEGGRQREALSLLEKGTFKVYKQYRIPFEGMYISNWNLQDDLLARWYGRISSRRLDAPEWVERILAYIDVKSGEYFIGFDRFVSNLMQGLDAKEPVYQEMAIKKAVETVNKWNAFTLSEALKEYRTAHNDQNPTSILQLKTMPALKSYESASIPRLLANALRYSDVMGIKGIDNDVLANFVEPDRVLLTTPVTEKLPNAKKMVDYQNIIFKDSLTSGTGIPISPERTPYTMNLAKLYDRASGSDEIFVTFDKLDEDAKEMLVTLRQLISTRKEELGRPPKDLNEVFYTEFKTPEPYGGHWIYNPTNGELKMSSRPTF